MRAQTMKTILLVAGILGVVQGMMALIGGLTAAHDYSKDDIPDSPSTHIVTQKYWCGMIRYIVAKGATKCEFDSLDRGWFYRTYKAKKDKTFTYPITATSSISVSEDKLKELTGYEAVVSYAIICGIGWMAAGALAIFASMKQKKFLAMIAGIVLAVLYALFIGLFGAVWDSVRKVNDDCQAVYDACPALNDHAKLSGREFLAYSICSFVLIMAAMVGCFLYAFLAVEGDTAGKVANNGNEATSVMSELPNKQREPDVTARALTKPNPMPTEPTKPLESQPAPKKAAVIAPPLPAPAAAPVAAAPAQQTLAKKNPFAEQFVKVNKYLVEADKLTQTAQKKFAEMDSDHSGKVSIGELKAFVAQIMSQKKLPAPTDEKVKALMVKYDKDKSGSLDGNEFKSMLFDIFMGSREVLIRKYAESKADELRAEFPPTKDTAGAQKLTAVLKDTAAFYKELEEIAKVVDKDKSKTLNHSEVTELVSRFCTKYSVPVMKSDRILAIMADMERPIKDYGVHDFRMIALAILTISARIALPK